MTVMQRPYRPPWRETSSPGTLYPTLHRMEAERLLTSRSEVVAGRRRRRYRATGQGRRELTKMRRALRELADEVLD